MNNVNKQCVDDSNTSQHSDNLDFSALYIIKPQIPSPDPCNSCQLKPLKLLYTPKLAKIVTNNRVSNQLLPLKESLLQLEQLRQEYIKEQRTNWNK